MVYYFIEMWVPRANFTDALVAVEESNDGLFLHEHIRPDGGRFPVREVCGITLLPEENPRPVWPMMKEWLAITLTADEELRDFERDEGSEGRQCAPGFCQIVGLNLEIDDSPSNRQWLENEADLILFRFGANTRGLNSVIAYSDSLHGWAVDLARAANAYSCAVRSDSGSVELLYVRGENYTSHWIEDGPDCPFGLGALIGLPVSETAKRAVALENARLPADEARVMEGLRDADSGVRGKALQVLCREASARAYNAVLTALDDDDWRLRALALDLLPNFDEFEADVKVPFVKSPLVEHQSGRKREHRRLVERMLIDRERGVRLEAERVLRHYTG